MSHPHAILNESHERPGPSPNFNNDRDILAEVIGHHGVWGAFAFWSPELDAIITGTLNTAKIDRRPLLGAILQALTS